MGTETLYFFIGIGATLYKTKVSISSDINGFSIGTGKLLLNKHYKTKQKFSSQSIVPAELRQERWAERSVLAEP